MNDQEKVSTYIEKHEHWRSQFTSFRKILGRTELTETVKWGAPSYILQGKIVVGFVGFKHHCALWFQQGVFLKDLRKKLLNAEEGTTRGMRQWRFETGDAVNAKLVRAYVLEAIENQKAGKQIKPIKKELVIPVELAAALKKSSKLRKGFDSLSPGKQREYADNISSARHEKTRLSRLEKTTPMIISGAGLNDHYKT